MSKATGYAAAVAAEMNNLSSVEATKPPQYTGPGGLIATVNHDATITIAYGQLTVPNIPAAIALQFRDWLTATLE